MNTSPVSLVVSLVAVAIAGLALWIARTPLEPASLLQPAQESTGPALADLQQAVEALRTDVAELQRDRAASAPAEETRQSEQLEERMAALEARLASVLEGGRGAAEDSAAGARPDAPVEAPADDDELARLQQRVLEGEATPRERTRFWELARTSGALPALIQRLEAAVQEDPQSVEARLQLAQAFVARLYTVPDGPERGAWASRAEEQWRQVLDSDPQNWEARYGLATSLSQWPPAFHKAPEAIRLFETLREQQGFQPAQPHHVGTYLQLAALYRQEGQPERALEVLKDGAARHPDSRALREALEGAGK